MVYLKQASWREVTQCTSAWSHRARHGCHEQVTRQKHERGSRHSRQEQSQHRVSRQTLLLMRLQTELCLRWTRQLLSQLLCRYALHVHSPSAHKEVKTTVVQHRSKTQSSYITLSYSALHCITSHCLELHCTMPEWYQRQTCPSGSWCLAKSMVH